jgi:hypothetical protein
MTRKAAKTMALWWHDDDAGPPVVGDAVAYVRAISPQLSRPSTDVTVSGDTTQSWVAGIPGGQLNISGVTDLTNNGDIQLYADFIAGTNHMFRLVPDASDTGDYFEGIGYVEQLTPLNGRHDGTFEFSATIRLTGTLTGWVSAV